MLCHPAPKPELKQGDLSRTVHTLEIQILVAVPGAERFLVGGPCCRIGPLWRASSWAGMAGATTPGNSLNSVSSFYLPINARPLPPPSPVAGSAIILAEGSTDCLIALASAKEHGRASESLGFWCPHSPGGPELILWAGLGVPVLTPVRHC